MKLIRTFSLACLTLTASGLVAQAPQPDPASAPHARRFERGPGGGRDRGPGGPGGMWWKDDATVKAIGLAPDQQKKIEAIFLQARIQLIHMHASLEEEQLKLEPLIDTNPVDQKAALAQINEIADLRAELEKTNAKMFLSIRSILTADQWTKLQAQHHMRHGGPMGERGRRGGFDGPGGPGGRRGPDGPADAK